MNLMLTKGEKISIAVVIVLLAGLLGFLSVKVAPSPSLGAGTYQIPSYAYSLDATSATTTLAAFPGTLHTIVFGTPVSGDVVTVYDSNTSTAPTAVIAKITTTSSTVFLLFDTSFTSGLTIQQSVTSTLTASYQQQ